MNRRDPLTGSNIDSPVIVIGVTVAVESAIDDVASVGAYPRVVGLDLVRDVETVNVHQSMFDAQIGIDQLVEIDLNLQVSSFDPVDGERARPQRVKFVQILATECVRFVTK